MLWQCFNSVKCCAEPGLPASQPEDLCIVYPAYPLPISALLLFLLLYSPAGLSARSAQVQEEVHAQVQEEVHAQVQAEPHEKYEVMGKVYRILPSSWGYWDIGIASWYGTKFHGRLTSLGEIYDMHGMTAAHTALPLPTQVKVTNLDNGKSVMLRVNDRGPFHEDRLIDLSYAAAQALGFQSQGTVPVVVEALDAINHPDKYLDIMQPDTEQPHKSSVYLQAGAFAVQQGALQRLAAVSGVLPASIPVRILRTETEAQVLHKVWIGPIWGRGEEDSVAAIVATMTRHNLGKTLQVKVD